MRRSMRLVITTTLFLAACAASSANIPSHPAVARYSTTVDEARAAVQEVLAGRSLHVDENGDAFTTGRECRTDVGEVCEHANAWHQTSELHTYAFQLGARVVQTDGGVIVKVGAVAVANGASPQTFETGKGAVPAWVQREVDSVQAEIRHRLAALRPTT